MLKTDPKRNGKSQYRCGTEVYIPGGTGNIDAGYLDAESFLRWLRMRGGYNPWAEGLAMRLLGYGDVPEVPLSSGQRAMAALCVAGAGDYGVAVDIEIRGVGRSQHQAELLLLGLDRHNDTFSL